MKKSSRTIFVDTQEISSESGVPEDENLGLGLGLGLELGLGLGLGFRV